MESLEISTHFDVTNAFKIFQIIPHLSTLGKISIYPFNPRLGSHQGFQNIFKESTYRTREGLSNIIKNPRKGIQVRP